MILEALNDYYRRLEGDPDSQIARFGYSEQKAAFAIVLNPDGTLNQFEDIRTVENDKQFNRQLVVPGQAKSSGSGLNPCFLWDNPAYLLGFKKDDPKPERTLQSFHAFRDKHKELEKTIDCPEFSAVCRFLESWDPKNATAYPVLKEFSSGFGVFQIVNERHFVHEHPKVIDYWQGQLLKADQEHKEIMPCLITGKLSPIAATHEPAIKGVKDAKSSGAKLVSFNCDAFNSYNKEQGFNSPVSEVAAFQYATALNHLLRFDSQQRINVGDTTTVFWTDQPSPAETLFSYLIDPSQLSQNKSTETEDKAQNQRIRAILKQVSEGSQPSELGDPTTRFYILGLAANASRLSVRYWHVSSLGDVIHRVGDHLAALRIDRGSNSKETEFPAVWQLLLETVRRGGKSIREDLDNVSPLLGGALIRSILTGSSYPQSLPLAVINRVRADQNVSATRAAILKAFLTRNLIQKTTMSLDSENPNTAYRLGRLFAALEKTQEDALPGINSTIRERFYSSASATPQAVFPRLLRTYQHHLAKLDGGRKTYRERLVQSILLPVSEFPTHLNLAGQSQFALGYYHQRQDFFTKKNHTVTESADSTPKSETTDQV
jgi:CRISPR-associated protein Csd1